MLDFDHLGDKDFNIASSLRDLKWQAILDEIAKCEVVVPTVTESGRLSVRGPCAW